MDLHPYTIYAIFATCAWMGFILARNTYIFLKWQHTWVKSVAFKDVDGRKNYNFNKELIKFLSTCCFKFRYYGLARSKINVIKTMDQLKSNLQFLSGLAEIAKEIAKEKAEEEKAKEE